MAKYCSNCGKKLENGEMCDCTKNVNSEVVSNYLTVIVNLLKGMFIHPVKTVKEFKEEGNFKIAIIFTLIASVIMGLFALILVKEFYETTTNAFTFAGYSLIQEVEIPYFETFIGVFIAAVALLFIEAGILYLVNSQIFKVKMNYKNAFNVITCLSVFTLATIILGSIGALISIYVTFVIMAIMSIFMVTCLSLINKEVFKLSDTKTLYSVILYYIIMAIVSYIIILIFN